MLLFRRQLRSRIAELENELSEMRSENAKLTQMAWFCRDGACIPMKRMTEDNERLSKENAELRVTNKGLASSVSELKAKIRAMKPRKEAAR